MENLLAKNEVLGSEMDELLGGKSITVTYTKTKRNGKTKTITITYEM